MINYDIHWNPVRLMQRIGRVDRRMNPEIEKRLVADHSEVVGSRGKVSFWNFLPPDELNAILTLYTKVTQKTLLISKTLGIEGKKLLTPKDNFAALKEFNPRLRGHQDRGRRHAPRVPGAASRPTPSWRRASSACPAPPSAAVSAWPKGRAACSSATRFPPSTRRQASSPRRRVRPAGTSTTSNAKPILEEPGEIAGSIRSKPETPRQCTAEEKTLVDIRAKIERHIKNTYLKRIDAPVGVKPSLKCWMELNEA